MCTDPNLVNMCFFCYFVILRQSDNYSIYLTAFFIVGFESSLWFILKLFALLKAPLVAQMVKNPPVMQETWVRKIPWSRAWQPTPVFLPGESPWTEEPGGLQSMGLQIET